MVEYQKNYSEIHRNNYEYKESRCTKGLKLYKIIKTAVKANLEELSILEIGCHTGRISMALVPYFKEYHAIDIDYKAIREAKSNDKDNQVKFKEMNAEKLIFNAESIDIVICAHVYEHVANPYNMMNEIYRVLKPNGICFFAASNKLHIIDPEYGLPLATLIPKKLAHLYVKIFRGLPEYYENFMMLPKLKNLVKNFKIIDYTKKVIKNPAKFHATDMVMDGTIKQKLALLILNQFYWLSPTYLWILKKKNFNRML